MPESARLATALGDRYRLERELGQGGMATVYLARDLKHQRDVALKVLRPELTAILGAGRFLHEIQITARLDHPHILTLIDSGEADSFLYYVLPLVRGESLRQKLLREQQLGVEEALAITRQVAGALDYAHRQGVVHRDIKPENILLHEGEAVLTDFGIALAVKQAGGNRLTETGLSLGTPQYMSPEQATGDRELDARSDIYSLGAVLYEMLAGEPPHTGPTAQAVIAKLMTERPTRLRVVRDTVPEGVDSAVARALAKLPVDRFARVDDFVRALDAPAAPDAMSLRAAVAAKQSGRARMGSRRRTLAIATLSFAALAVVAWALLRPRTGRVILPDRVQLTFTGNARTPALSADGKRLAYSTRQCDDQGRCTTDVVIQDLEGGSSTTLLQGWSGVWNLQWTGDGRYLLLDGFAGAGGNWGIHSISTLGGRPRFLSRGNGGLIGTTDTALVMHEVAGDSLAWFRWITVADGVVHDSISVPRGVGAGVLDAKPFPGGRRIMAVRIGAAKRTVLILDRSGRILDSLALEDPGIHHLGIEPTWDGRALLMSAGRPFEELGQGPFNLLAWRMTSRGRFAPRPDTILRELAGRFRQTPAGELLLAFGPARSEVWAMERSGPLSMDLVQHRLASATSRLRGALSPQGDKVLLQRTAVAADGMQSRFSTVPFSGGPETPFDTPPGLLGASWSWDGSGVWLYRLSHPDTVAIEELDPSTGRSRPLFRIWWRNFIGPPAPYPGGGLLFPVIGPAGIRRVGAPGLPDTTFLLPAYRILGFGLASAPDGKSVAWIGWDPQGDSLLVERVSLEDGSVTRLASFFPEGAKAPVWLADGTLLVPVEETAAALAWYRIPLDGGPPLRLGSPPRYPAEYDMSRDGRRIIATTWEDSPDIYLIRNFSRLLER